MAQNNKGVLEISPEGLNEILKAYNTIGNFLEHYISPELLYKQEFNKGMKVAFKEVRNKKKVKGFIVNRKNKLSDNIDKN